MYLPKPIFFAICIIIGVAITWMGIGSLKTIPEAFNPLPLAIGGVFLIIALVVYWLAFAIGSGFFAIFFAVLHGFTFSSIEELNLTLMMLSLAIGLLIGAAIGFLLVYHDWLFTRYAITDRRVIAQYGVFNKIYAYCHLDKIQSVSLAQSFLERRLHFGTVIFATASEAGGTGLIGRGLSKMYAKGAIVWRSINRPFETLTKIENMLNE
jgi:membrane protein YdbS with pleckstrin-like domain